MSHEFFTMLGQELCSFKNSPFLPLGEKRAAADDMLRSGISYDPNRLFNREKYEEKIKNSDQKDYVELMQKQRIEEQKVQFQILREATRQDFERKLKELRQSDKQQSSSRQHTPFRVERTACSLCNKCNVFEGNFTKYPRPSLSDPTQMVSFLRCLHCRCPMNGHLPYLPIPSLRPKIWSYLKSKILKDHHLQAPYFVAAFKVQDLKSNQTLYMLGELLERAGYQIYNKKIIDRWTYEMALLRCVLLRNGEDPGMLQAMLHLVSCVESVGKWTNDLGVGQQFQQQYSILKKIAADVRARDTSELNKENAVIVMLIHQSGEMKASENKALLQNLNEYIQKVKVIHVSDTKRECLLQAQQLFAEQFQLKSRLFLLPLSSPKLQNFYEFKDLLDFNNYTILFENITNIRKDHIQSVFNFLPYHHLNFLLDKDVMTPVIPKFPLIFAVKTGVQNLEHYGPLQPHIQVIAQDQKYKVTKQLFPNYCLGQRCIVILRPFILGTGCQQVLINLLRHNNFIIIQRRRTKLSYEQGKYLSVLEHIDDEDLQSYMQLMTTGVADVLLLSKRSAIYEAHALLNGCDKGRSNINPKWIRNKPVMETKKGRDIFRHDLTMPMGSKSAAIFTGGSAVVNMERCLFNQGWGKTNIIQNCKTGELIKVQQKFHEQDDLKITLRMREQLLWQLKFDNFNYTLFNSKSQKSSEELVSLFFPECTLFESAIVIVKPTYLHLLDVIKSNLVMLRYHLIFQKTVQLSKGFTQQLLNTLQKVKLDRQTFQQVIDLYSGQRITFLCISKVSAKKQILSLLANFSFFGGKTIIHEQNCEEMMREVLLPVWTGQEQFLKIFNRHLANLQEAVELITSGVEGNIKPEQKLQVLEYFVGSIFGTKPADIQLNTAIGRLSYYNTSSILSKYQSWYYATISHVYNHYAPLLFQYRQFAGSTLVLQSYSGEPFMASIVNHYLAEKDQIERKIQRSSIDRSTYKRSSLVLLLWAKKIFKMVEELSSLNAQNAKIPIDLSGWGTIIFRNNEYKGEYNSEELMQEQKKFLQAVIKKYSGNRYIVANCTKMLGSRLLEERYRQQQRRLLPNFGQIGMEESLRVMETAEVSKLFLNNQFQMIDPDNEKNNLHKQQLVSLNLYRVQPYIGTKYQFLVDLLIFFDKWKEEALDYREVFAEMLEHFKSFLTKYEELEFLEYEYYLKQLKLLMKEQITEEKVKSYPIYRKNRMRTAADPNQEVIGKNRKFVEQRQYFKGWKEHSDQYLEQFRQKYTKFNLKTLDEPLEPNILNNPDDVLHQNWANQQNYVNLLREEKVPVNAWQEKGLYVQYEKRLNENEEKIKNEIQSQVQKLNNRREETILRDNGLDNDLWYKKVKEGDNKGLSQNRKVDDAINKQLEKLKSFKNGGQFKQS